MDRVEVKDVRVPEQLMRAMAAEAEAAREARAKVIAAEGEHKSSKALMNAAQNIVRCPVALQVTRTIWADYRVTQITIYENNLIRIRTLVCLSACLFICPTFLI